MLEPYYEHGGITIYHGDCREILPGLELVDIVLTDPPYGIRKLWEKPYIAPRGSSRLWGFGETWDENAPPESLIAATARAGDRAIIWGGNYFVGLPPTRGWLVWDKVQRWSGSDAELAWTDLDIPVRVFRMSRIDAYHNCAEGMKSHPTEKPIQLMRWCLGLDADAVTVLDPFMGSGTTLRAAKDLGRKAIGIEIEEKYCEIAAKRLAQEVFDFQHAP